MQALILDTETTSADDPHLIELAYIKLTEGDLVDLRVSETYEQRFNPQVPSSLGALATHNILDSELTECPHPDTFTLPECDYLIGHNIDFDWRVIKEPDVKRIDTLCLARNIWPNLDSHKLGACLYHVMGDDAKPLVTGAHGALNDCEMVRHLLRYLVPHYKVDNPFTWEALYMASEFARIPAYMPFGKHKGTPIKDLPADYVRWLKTTDIDEYLRKALS